MSRRKKRKEERVERETEPADDKRVYLSSEWVLISILVILSLFLRFYGNTIPGIFDSDEKIYIVAGLRKAVSMSEPDFQPEHPPFAKDILGLFLRMLYRKEEIYLPEIMQLTPSFFYGTIHPSIQQMVYKVLGTARSVAGFFVFLSSIVIYFIAKELYGKGTARICFLLSLFSITMIAYSRIFILDTIMVLFWYLSIYFMIKNMKGKSIVNSVLLGLSLGACMGMKSQMAWVLLFGIVLIMALFKKFKQIGVSLTLSILLYFVGIKFMIGTAIRQQILEFGVATAGNLYNRMLLFFGKENPVLVIGGIVGALGLFRSIWNRGIIKISSKKLILLLLLGIHVLFILGSPKPRFTLSTICVFILFSGDLLSRFDKKTVYTIVALTAVDAIFYFPDYLMYQSPLVGSKLNLFIEHDSQDYWDGYVVRDVADYLNSIVSDNDIIASQTNVNGLLLKGKLIPTEILFPSVRYMNLKELKQKNASYLVVFRDNLLGMFEDCKVKVFEKSGVEIMRVYNLSTCGE